jgi:BirA family biotin operon repressor/biotin-[acetyl-CoA-carboxylase] ligase
MGMHGGKRMELTAANLQQRLAPRPVRFYPQVGSTQDIALTWLQQGAESGAVVIADEQLAGRGRAGRTWHTPPGAALALSVILYPPAESLPRITMLGAVAIAELLEGIGASDVSIKWPNDVCLNRRKVSGVLPEAAWEGNRLIGVALGIGINVRNDFCGTPLQETAISIEPALERTFDRINLIARLLARIDRWTELLGTAELLEAWKARLKTLGQDVTVASAAGTVSGIAESVDEQGALFIREDDGTLRRVIVGDTLSNQG